MSTPTTDPPMPSSAEHRHSQNPRFQRLFSDEDEIRLLRAFSKIIKSTNSREVPSASAIDSPSIHRFNKHLRSKFSAKQLNNKLRRFRRKYQSQVKNRSSVKTHHDQEVFEICGQIWGKEEEGDDSGEDDQGPEEDDQGPEEDNRRPEENAQVSEKDGDEVLKDKSVEMKGEIDFQKYPFLVKEFERCFPESNVVWREGFRRLEGKKLRDWNEKWKLLQIEEAMVMTKRSEMVQEQMKELLGLVLSNSGTGES